MYKFIIIAAAFLLAFFGYHLFIPSTSSVESPLIVGTNAEYPPYTFIEEGEIVGFDIDVVKEVSQRLHKHMVLKDMPFDALISSLMLGKIDLIAAGLTRTEERCKNVLFTKAYVSGDSLVILSRKEEGIQSVQDLVGKKVVVNEGYTADVYISQFPNLNVVRLSAPADAFIALTHKKADAFIAAKSTIEPFFKEHLKEEYNVIPVGEVSDGVSMALPKKDIQLCVEIDKIIEEMTADGTLLKLKQKWGLS